MRKPTRTQNKTQNPLDQQSVRSGQEDAREENVDGTNVPLVDDHQSKPSTNRGKKRPVSTNNSDNVQQDLRDDEVPAKKKKMVSATSEAQDANQARRTRSQTASTEAGYHSNNTEPANHSVPTKPLASKSTRSGEEVKKKDTSSTRGLSRLDSDSEDWDEDAIETHYVVNDKLNTRIKALIEWEDKENAIYSPANVPKAGAWAQIGSNKEWTWCTSAASATPVIFCCVGRVTYNAFYTEGSPQREVTITIHTVEPKDKGHLQKFLKRHTTGSTPEWDNIKFTRFQAKKSDADAKPFKRYYDARKAGSYPNDNASILSVREDLRNGDLVIVEATAIRFSTFNSPNKKWGSSPEKGEKRWVARFRLMTIWKLLDSEVESSDEEDEAGPSRRKGKGKLV